MTRRGALLVLLLVPLVRAQDADPFGSAPDPFATAPVGSVAAVASPAGFDPEAVSLTRPAPGLEVHGRANLTLASVSRDREEVDLLEEESLELSSAGLYAQWFPLAWLGALGEVELETEVENGERELEVEVDLLTLELRPFGDERLRLRAGFFPAPFGIERRYYSPPRNALANRPAAFLRVWPGLYTDLGVEAWLRQPISSFGSELELEVALVRGLEGPGIEDRPETFQGDANDEPQLVGRIGLTLVDLDPARKDEVPFPVRLTFGASALHGHHDDRARRQLTFVGWDAELILGGLRLRFEAVVSHAEGFDAAGRTLRGAGLYALAAYHLRPQRFLLEDLFLAFRFDAINPDRGVPSQLDLLRYHWGVGWSPVEGLLLKAGWELSRPSEESSRSVIFLELGYSF